MYLTYEVFKFWKKYFGFFEVNLIAININEVGTYLPIYNDYVWSDEYYVSKQVWLINQSRHDGE